MLSKGPQQHLSKTPTHLWWGWSPAQVESGLDFDLDLDLVVVVVVVAAVARLDIADLVALFLVVAPALAAPAAFVAVVLARDVAVRARFPLLPFTTGGSLMNNLFAGAGSC